MRVSVNLRSCVYSFFFLLSSNNGDGLLTLNEQYLLISMEFSSVHVFFFSSILYCVAVANHFIHFTYIYICSLSNAKISLLGKCLKQLRSKFTHIDCQMSRVALKK